jgi:hypothetical protein
MAAVSLRANYLFGYGFGQTPEKATIFGSANVAADVWKIFGLLVITTLWRARQRRYAATLFPIWAMCFAWGIAGAMGVYAQDRTTLVGEREIAATNYRETRSELTDLESKLAALKSERSPAQLDAVARPVLSRDRVRGTVGKLSANCAEEDRARTPERAKMSQSERASERKAPRPLFLRRGHVPKAWRRRRGGEAPTPSYQPSCTAILGPSQGEHPSKSPSDLKLKEMSVSEVWPAKELTRTAIE